MYATTQMNLDDYVIPLQEVPSAVKLVETECRIVVVKEWGVIDIIK